MKELFKKNIINLRGKHLKKKLIVLESDDWGSIRIPSREVSLALINKGLLSSKDPFDTIDSLENEQDLEFLFDILNKFNDHRGNHPVITANMVMANPDFEAIESAHFEQFKYELFTETYRKLHKTSNAIIFLQQGIDSGVFFPQFHAREHLNSSLWMQYLRKGEKDFIAAFDQKCFSIHDKSPINRRKNIMATYDYYSNEDLNVIQDSIREGLEIFESTFGKKSETTIPPCYVWDSKIEEVFNKEGIFTFQGSKYQNIPLPTTTKFKRRLRYMGQREGGNTYFIRNCLFEPSLDDKIDWVDKCLESIKIAFLWQKPAIIGTHRINFSGAIKPLNRERNLQKLELLLSSILKNWPEVEFISSAELISIYK